MRPSTTRQLLLAAAIVGLSAACAADSNKSAEAPPADGASSDYTRRSSTAPSRHVYEEAEYANDEIAAAEPLEQAAPPAPSQDAKRDIAYNKSVETTPSAPVTSASKPTIAGPPPAKPVSTIAEPVVRPPEPVDVRVSEKNSRGEEYTNHGVNPMVDTDKEPTSTFAVDVDTGAYTIARRKLREGVLPQADGVRVEEFVNYFNYQYPKPDSGAFGVYLEAAPSPFTAQERRYLMRVGVQGKHIAASERKPVHLTFLVDVSGSMSGADRIELAKKALTILTNTLRAGDTVAIATYAGRSAIVLPATDAVNKGKILDAIKSLHTGGGTSMGSGMELAYQQAMSTYKAGHVNRVIVLSDGDANIGPVSQAEIHKQVRHYVEEGITLSTIGFGMGNYRDTLMEQLANKGNGNYYYIDGIEEARKVFGEQVDGTLEVIAKDVKIQVEFHPKTVANYRLIGYENRHIDNKDFRDDRVDAGEIGAGHTVTAFYEVVLRGAPDAKQDWATVRVRHKQPEGHVASEQTFMMSGREVKTKLVEASRDFQFGAAVVAFAEILRKSPYAEGLSFALVEELAQAASSPAQKDRQEFIELVRRAKQLSSRGG